MVNWYYVRGSERVGPVSVDVLQDLFEKKEISLESYVWRKGFQNWERLKDIAELDMSRKVSVVAEKEIEIQLSPEVDFNFDWKKIREDEELFFIKIGTDRSHFFEAECFGPYTLTELREAKEEKRINDKTLLYAVGLPGWIEVGETPINPIRFDVNLRQVKAEAPLLLVMGNDPLPLVALVGKVGSSECTILGTGPFSEGSEKLCSIYEGKELKAKNVKINIEHYEPNHQRAFCKIVEMGDDARRVIQNYA